METFFLTRQSSTPNVSFLSKYKPYYIDDFVGNKQLISVILSLKQIDELNVLISGPSNCGKTSLLYAIIRNYYKLDKTQTLPESNIMFINSLKEQGINYYRNEMKSFCQSKCSIIGKKKLVIVDDMDLINEQCQQVFRNHIDKYKSNILFVSVCSNIHKVIESIQSRLHIIKMITPDFHNVREITNKVIQCERLVIEPDAREYLLSFSKFSIRQVLSHLEKMVILNDSTTVFTIDICKNILSNISQHQFEEFVHCLQENNLKKGIDILYSIYDYGYSVIDILDMFYSFIKSTDILDENRKYELLPIICNYITYFHNLHEDSIELVMFSHEVYNSIREESEKKI